MNKWFLPQAKRQRIWILVSFMPFNAQIFCSSLSICFSLVLRNEKKKVNRKLEWACKWCEFLSFSFLFIWQFRIFKCDDRSAILAKSETSIEVFFFLTFLFTLCYVWANTFAIQNCCHVEENVVFYSKKNRKLLTKEKIYENSLLEREKLMENFNIINLYNFIFIAASLMFDI